MIHRSNYLLSLLICFFAWGNVQAQTGFTIEESLMGNAAGELVLGGAAKLTGGDEDPLGSGWLRLTPAVQHQSGYAVVNKAFPSTLGVEVDFEFVVWGGNGADGFSIFLFDANYDPDLGNGDPYQFRIGGAGGSLGYANNGATPGLSGGYLGFGIDEWGNYVIDVGDKNGGVGGSRVPNSIGVRGPESRDYEWIGGNTNLGFTLDYKPQTNGLRPDPAIYYRHIFLMVEPVYVNGHITHYELSSKIKIRPDGDAILILDRLKIEDMPPNFLKVGFAASTGGNTHFHEVRNLTVTTPADLWVRKSVDKSEARVTDELTYTITMMNQFDLQAEHLELRDALPAHFQVESITFTDDGKPGTEIVSGWSPGELSLDQVIMNLAPFGEATFEIRGKVTDVPDDNLLTNTVTLDATDLTGFSDTKQENNISTATTYIIKPEITIQDDAYEMRLGVPLERMNVLDNDRVDGEAVDLQEFDLAVVTAAEPIDGQGVPYLDVHSGDIVLPADIGIGAYAIVYRICEQINSNNCKEGQVFIRIDPNVVLAVEDDFGTFREGQDHVTVSVLSNDTWNEQIVGTQKLLFTWESAAPEGIVLHDDGRVTIRSSAQHGDYTFSYKICDVMDVGNCQESTATLSIRNILDAKDDYYELVIDRGPVITGSVLDNDIHEDLSISTSELLLIPGTPSHPSMRMDSDGRITLPEGTRVERYTYTYRVCEAVRPGNCQDVVAVIDIKAKDLFVPNVITPNGDGVNDRLEVVGYEYYDKIDLTVFNSGGIEVYRSVNYQNDWDARGLHEDVYYYILSLERNGERTVRRRGYILVKRR